MSAMALVPRLGAKTPGGFSPGGPLGSGHLGRDPSHKDRLEWPGDPRRGDSGGQPASSLPTPGAIGDRSSEMGSPRPTQGPRGICHTRQAPAAVTRHRPGCPSAPPAPLDSAGGRWVGEGDQVGLRESATGVSPPKARA